MPENAVLEIPVALPRSDTYGKMGVGLYCDIGMGTSLVWPLNGYTHFRFDTLKKFIDAARFGSTHNALAKQRFEHTLGIIAG